MKKRELLYVCDRLGIGYKKSATKDELFDNIYKIKKDDLIIFCEEYGIRFSKSWTKEKIIQAISDVEEKPKLKKKSLEFEDVKIFGSEQALNLFRKFLQCEN